MRDELLIVVDMQNDFVTPGGALYFKSAESVKPVVVDCVRAYVEKEQHVIFTQDWHVQDDVEFKLFPPHCVANTFGAELFEELKKTIENYEYVSFVHKRKFSAFYGTNLDILLKQLNPTKIGICGVATNICVMYTAEELRNREYNVVLYENGVASYDEALHEFAISQMKDVLGVEIGKWR